MAMNNIALFDLYVGKILAKLYNTFPLKVEIDVCEMTGLSIDEESMNIPKECQIFNDTMEWLHESGYLYYQQSYPYAFSRVVLSAKGLEVLKSTPQSLQQKDGIGETLRDAVAHGKNELIRLSVNTILSHGTTLAFGAMAGQS